MTDLQLLRNLTAMEQSEADRALLADRKPRTERSYALAAYRAANKAALRRKFIEIGRARRELQA